MKSRIAFNWLLLSLIPTIALAQKADVRPAHIILIRHADKPADSTDPHLSPAGVKRAQALVTFITRDPAMTQLGAPVAIFATRTTRNGDGVRTQETVTPLAHALNVTLQLPDVGKNFAALTATVLANPAYAGKTVLICWNHEDIPQLAAAFGVTPEPPKWKGSEFGQVYIISYHNRKATLTVSRYGDR